MRFLSPVSGRLLSAILASNLLLTSVASAAPPTPPRPAAPLVDEVRLVDGTLLRGTILEQTAGGDVTFSTATGDVRKLAKKDIVYAGPIGGAPATFAPLPAPSSPAVAPAPPPPPPPPGAPPPPRAEASVALSADTPDVRVHLRESSATTKFAIAGSGGNGLQLDTLIYRPICVAPCTATVPAGLQRFGLSHGESGVVDVAADVDAKPGSTIAFHFESNESTRSTGKVLLWGGILGGSAASVVGLAVAVSSGMSGSTQDQFNATESHVTTGLLIGGIGMGLGLASAIVGALLTGTKDEATLAPPPTAGSSAPVDVDAAKTAPAKAAPAEEGSFPGSQQ